MLDEIPDDDDWLSDDYDVQSELGQDDIDEPDHAVEVAQTSQTAARVQGQRERNVGKEIDFPVFREEIWP